MEWLAWTTSAEGWISLLTLTVLEIVLGIDNIVFISILAGKLRDDQRERARSVGLSLAMFIRILLLDIVFSLDSVITAVGMASEVSIMIIAVVIAVGVMLLAAGTISAFVQKHPTVKMLALAFLILIGVALIADGLGFHIPRGYIYFAMAFAAIVEIFNVLARRRKTAS